MAKKKTASRPGAAYALTLLRKDHAEVTALFDKYEKGMKRMDDAKKTELALQICDMLTVHARIEEEIFYPACQEIEGLEDILAEAKVEHQGAKDLIAKISADRAGDEDYDAMVTVLGEYIRHHVKEEHGELFPKVKKSDLDLKELGEQLEARKQELMSASGSERKEAREGTGAHRAL